MQTGNERPRIGTPYLSVRTTVHPRVCKKDFTLDTNPDYRPPLCLSSPVSCLPASSGLRTLSSIKEGSTRRTYERNSLPPSTPTTCPRIPNVVLRYCTILVPGGSKGRLCVKSGKYGTKNRGEGHRGLWPLVLDKVLRTIFRSGRTSLCDDSLLKYGRTSLGSWLRGTKTLCLSRSPNLSETDSRTEGSHSVRTGSLCPCFLFYPGLGPFLSEGTIPDPT